jgi:molybdate-binding protein
MVGFATTITWCGVEVKRINWHSYTMKKIAVEQLQPLLEDNKGNVAAVARKLGVSRTAVYNRINESATLQQVLADARESMLDNAESVLYKKVLEGSTAELIFFLKTQGRNRGYVERQEIDHRMKDVSELSDDELHAIVAAKSSGGT